MRSRDLLGDMAYFRDRDDKPAAYVQQHVRSCQVYVGLIGLRYGSPVPDRPEVSYTELEFETATEARMPQLVVMLDEDAVLPIPPSQMLDRDPALMLRQRAFRDRLDARLLVRKFASPEQVELLLFHGLQAQRGPPQRIFISYRHGDADYAAHWLRDHLSGRYGKDQVFLDINSIALGSNFADEIASKLSTCEVLLACIGNRWLTTTNAEGTRRIDDPNDFVSLEIATALARNILVIPILIDGATMPSRSDLPDRIAHLADCNALKVSADSFDSDTERLFEELDNASSPPGTGN